VRFSARTRRYNTWRASWRVFCGFIVSQRHGKQHFAWGGSRRGDAHQPMLADSPHRRRITSSGEAISLRLRLKRRRRWRADLERATSGNEQPSLITASNVAILARYRANKSRNRNFGDRFRLNCNRNWCTMQLRDRFCYHPLQSANSIAIEPSYQTTSA